MYVQESPVESTKSNTLALDRPESHRHAACIVTQQYFSATFVSLRYHSLKEKSGLFKKTLFKFILLL
jgi:hypothetical protein